MLSSSTFMMLILSNPSPSKASQRKSSCGHSTGWFTPTSQNRASNRNFTRWITKHLTTLKPSFAKRLHASSTPHLTYTAPVWWNRIFVRGRIDSSLALLGFQKNFQIAKWCISLIKQTSRSTCYGHSIKILLSWHSRHSKGPTLLMQHQ
jgi:hypothetical protein